MTSAVPIALRCTRTIGSLKLRTAICMTVLTPRLLAQAGIPVERADLRNDLAKLNVRQRTEHYSLAGSVSDARLAEYGRCLEYIYKEYAKGFSNLLAPAQPAKTGDSARVEEDHPARRGTPSETSQAKPAEVTSLGEEGNRFPVIVYAKDDEYLEFSQKYFAGDLEHTRGAFVPALKLLIVRDDPNSSETFETLFHEAFHQFADEYIPMLPTWLNEGLATYYGVARPTGSGLVFDRPASMYFRIVRDAKEAKLLVPLRDLMLMSHADFRQRHEVGNLSMTHQTLCYGQAYTLVVYILNDPAGLTLLRRFLKDLAAAKTSSDVQEITDRHFDKKLLDAMSAEWLTFCQKH